MTIQLKPEQEKFIQEKIASGEYRNADDVISQAFKLLEAREKKQKNFEKKLLLAHNKLLMDK
jgi:antitoxin ParD1/3/4